MSTPLQELLDRLGTRYGRKAAEYGSFYIEREDYSALVARLRAAEELADGFDVHAITEEVWGADNPEATGGEWEAGYWRAMRYAAHCIRAALNGAQS